MSGSDRADARGLFAGTYAKGGGAGLVRLDGDAGDALNSGEAFDFIRNASYGVYSRRFGLHFLVDEMAGTLSAYGRDRGCWLALSEVETGGEEPCFVALNPDESCLAVANYGSGSVALFNLDPVFGLPNSAPAVHQQQGSGPNPERQEGPHVHCARFSPDGRWLVIADLGSDQLLAFDMHGVGLGRPLPLYDAPPGSGPRHVLFTPSGKQALLLSELASSLTLFDVEGERFVPRQTVSTLPDGDDSDNLGGHLALNEAGDRVYVSNRGHDSIAVLALDVAGGLNRLQHVRSGGRSPRFFLLREKMQDMLVAHEQSGSVARLLLKRGGILGEPCAVIDVPGAVFILEHESTEARIEPRARS